MSLRLAKTAGDLLLTFEGRSINGASADFSEWQLGWVAGFGAEYAWTDRISFTSDTLYVDFLDRQRSASIALSTRRA